MLLSMGWSPSATTLNPNASPGQRKPVIPIAKEGTLGLGATRQTMASSVFSRFGSHGLKFVSAGAREEQLRRAKTEGNDFGGLLARLNSLAGGAKGKDEQDESGAKEEEDPSKEEKRKRKEAKREKKRKREEGDEEQQEKEEESSSTSTNNTPVLPPPASTSSSTPRLLNPRMAYVPCFSTLSIIMPA
jgi:hypothetical protein